ncbi:helix-turn-helix transcriptional regulator [Phytohabitans sp. ZYX-F-186]|uniref:Helix-turn-helix transcriptional regulator n=1 Tax=Phytohabitans maris TaxID=3071409 RepID=A0ABU0ZCN5_9ACTN|nr:helix-turn-helix transcriptional regulator [Phytohabitans sp. ZYX-F-186]MDQ7904829.1 helix-turn-helix transcriptional regulator [Phytohabitans sp. ZYX-F-186]
MTVAVVPIADLSARVGADSRFASAFAVLRDVATSDQAPNETTARLASVLLDVLSVLVTDPATTPATGYDWRTLRQRRGWTQAQMFRHLTRVAEDLGERLPSWASFKRNLSRWENGTVRPSPYYQRLLLPLFGLADSTTGGAA